MTQEEFEREQAIERVERKGGILTANPYRAPGERVTAERYTYAEWLDAHAKWVKQDNGAIQVTVIGVIAITLLMMLSRL